MIKLKTLGHKKVLIVIAGLLALVAMIIGGFLLFTMVQQKSGIDKVVGRLELPSNYQITSKRSDQLICWTSDCGTTVTWRVPKTSRAVFEEVSEKLKRNGFSVDEDELYYEGNPKVTDFSFRGFYRDDKQYYRLQILVEDGLELGQSEFRPQPESKLIFQIYDLTSFTF